LKKLRIKIQATTDLLQALSNLRGQLESLGIPVDERDNLLKKVGESANDLARRGNQLISIGSQFLVERVFTSESCEVVLDAEFTSLKPTLGCRLRALFSKLRG
jgi:hypothetical protein